MALGMTRRLVGGWIENRSIEAKARNKAKAHRGPDLLSANRKSVGEIVLWIAFKAEARTRQQRAERPRKLKTSCFASFGSINRPFMWVTSPCLRLKRQL